MANRCYDNVESCLRRKKKRSIFVRKEFGDWLEYSSIRQAVGSAEGVPLTQNALHIPQYFVPILLLVSRLEAFLTYTQLTTTGYTPCFRSTAHQLASSHFFSPDIPFLPKLHPTTLPPYQTFLSYTVFNNNISTCTS